MAEDHGRAESPARSAKACSRNGIRNREAEVTLKTRAHGRQIRILPAWRWPLEIQLDAGPGAGPQPSPCAHVRSGHPAHRRNTLKHRSVREIRRGSLPGE